MTRRHNYAQRLAQPALVDLYDIDITRYGGGIRRWTPGPMGAASGNHVYNPSPRGNLFGWGAPTDATAPARFETVQQSWAADDPTYAIDEGAGFASWTSIPANASRAFWWSVRSRMAPGMAVQVQARVLPIRCRARVEIHFYNGATFLSSLVSPWAGNAGQTSPQRDIANFMHIWAQGVAPANTTEVGLVFTVVPFTDGASATTPGVFWGRAALTMAAQAFPNRPYAFAWGQKGGSVSFGGQVYTPIPVKMEGLQKAGRGAVPRVTVTVPDVDGLMTNLLLTYGQLLGCPITRRQVFSTSLDDGREPDPTDFFGPDVFYVDRVAKHAPGVMVELECASPLDMQGTMLPARQVIANVCDHTYRVWNAGAFEQGSCPYAGANYFGLSNQVVGNPIDDKCAKNLGACRLRFGTNQPLPMRAFPGVRRTRY